MHNSFKQWFYLNEMPITNWQTIGNWGPKDKKYGFGGKDIGILTNAKGVDKIHRSWSNTIYDFELYFVRQSGAKKYLQHGEASKEFVKSAFDLDINPKPDSISVIYTNNIGDNKVPMTGWILAHRLAHSISNQFLFEQLFKLILRDIKEILLEVYGILIENMFSYRDKRLLSFCKAIGTMKSARDMNIDSFYEFVFELISQWIITGHVKFNPLPRKIATFAAYGRKDHYASRLVSDDFEIWAENLDMNSRTYAHMIEDLFGGLLNKIFIM